MVIDPVDPAFGVATVELAKATHGARPRLVGMAIAPAGRVAVLIAQESPPGPCAGHDVSAVMFDSHGALDAAFGADGRASSGLLGLPPCVAGGSLGFAIAADGSLFIAANAQTGGARIYKARATGTVDPAFGSDGSAAVPGVGSFRRPTLQVLRDGSIAAGGPALLPDATNALAVVRLRADGAPDQTWGHGGVALAAPPDRPVHAQEGGGMAVNADGSALVAGNIFEDDAGARIYTDATVARFDSRGFLDATYGERGFAIARRDASTYAHTLAVRDGVAYLAGVQNRDVPFAFVAKIDARGQVDQAFAEAGFAGTDDFRETGFDPVVAVDAAHRVYYLTTDGQSMPRVTRLRNDGTQDSAFGLAGSAYPAASGWGILGRNELRLDDDGRLHVAAELAMRDGSERVGIGVTRFIESGGHREGVAGGTAVIYHHRDLDHYFLTANPQEQALLDNGVTAGWQRTGDRFRVVASLAPDPEITPVCRFYGRPEAGLDSHFFSAAPDECASVAERFSASWQLETREAFQVHMPDRLTGACPRGSYAVLRAFNGRADANHYYGTLPAAPAGWIYEGYGTGPHPTAFCAPLL
jgi:uncharacterized delta-60 repeat protein